MKVEPTEFTRRFSPCPHCHGTGHEIDHERVGRMLRERRERCNITRTAMAEKMGISGSLLFDLELGRRSWLLKHLDAFTAACAEAEGKH